MSSDEFSSILKDSTEEGWRQLDSIKKLSNFKNDQSLDTLFQLALSSKQDPQGKFYGTNSGRLRRTEFDPKDSSEVRWTAADSISRMGEFSLSKTLDFIKDRKKYYLAHSERIPYGRAQVSKEALTEDIKILLWILGELRTEKSIKICKNILKSRNFSKELQTYAMNALQKNGNLTKHIFIENLGTNENARKLRYYLAGAALSSYGISIIPDLMEIKIDNDIELLIRIIDILNHINNENFNETIMKYFIDVLFKYDLASKTSDTIYEMNENVPTVYSKIRSSLIKNRQKSISYLKQQESHLVNEDHKIGIIRAMGLMDDPIFLQSMISFTQDNSFKIREEVMKWYKRLNHRLVLWVDASTFPEMQSFTDSKSIVDISLLEKDGIKT